MTNQIKITALSWMLIAGLYVDVANAGHHDEALCRQAEALHVAACDFESLLCTRPATSVDVHRAELLKKRVCRIRDKIRAGECIRRVDCALTDVNHALLSMQRSMDGCDFLRYDRQLQRSWFAVQDEFDRLDYLVKAELLRCRPTPVQVRVPVRTAKPTIRIEYHSGPRYAPIPVPPPVRHIRTHSTCPNARPVYHHHRTHYHPPVIEHHHHTNGSAVAVGLILSALLD